MTKHNNSIAEVEKINHWSPVWLIPIITALISIWILFYHFSHQGLVITLVTTSVDGLEAGKTKIKSRSVNVGVVESLRLSEDLSQVLIQARINSGMEKLLHQDSIFWVVKPHISREGLSGLGTLLSGPYIELQPGNTSTINQYSYPLLNNPPLITPKAKGLRVILDSAKSGHMNAGDPVLFRGYHVGLVENSYLDPKTRVMHYQLFIPAPYDQLVTTNVRFWKDSGVAFNMSAQGGMRVEIGSLTTLFSSGISFDVPDGWDRGRGKRAKEKAKYELFDNQHKTQEDIRYPIHKDYLLFFSDSVRGLQPGAPVEFRGIRLGTVAQVPFYKKDIQQHLTNNYRIPVLIRIEPDYFRKQVGDSFEFKNNPKDAAKYGICASLKSANMLTGVLYIDLDFYPREKIRQEPHELFGYPLIPTISSSLIQIQKKLIQVLDKINMTPLNPMINAATKALAKSYRTMEATQQTMKSLNNIISSQEIKVLPKYMQRTLQELHRSIKGFQQGSPAYNEMLSDMQRLEQVLRELQPILRTLNEKSNALIFEAANNHDLKPKKANT